MGQNFSSDVLHALHAISGHLLDRSAVLLLGAGINFGTTSKDGATFPLGADLSKLITSKLLGDCDATLDLNDAADIARRKFGEGPLNQFIHAEFAKYAPNTAHFAIAQLPWNCVYTTNYDLLIEQASESHVENVTTRFKAIFSASTDLTLVLDSDVPYYKLHGSIDYANTFPGRLILTREDYRSYEENRIQLFRRLRSDLASKTFVFVGYGLKDDNFRTILDEVRTALGTQSLPASFAIKRDFSKVEAEYWKDKYNVQLLSVDATEFLVALRDTKEAEITTNSYESWRQASTSHSDTAKYSFPQIGVSFYKLIPVACGGSSNPELYFKGGSYTWPDAREKVAPNRDSYWTLMELIFADLAEPTLPASIYLISGPAGTGKTTLCRSIAFDMASDLNTIVLLHIPGTPLDPRAFGALVDLEAPQRILVFIRDGATYIDELGNFMSELKRMRLPVSVIIEERKNEWSVASQKATRRVGATEIELGPVSESEIEKILDSLSKFDCLGKLTGLDRTFQTQHFASLADKDLLVALRELTSNSNFDEIVNDEFNSVPSELAKRAYLYVAAVGQANIALRYEHLIRLTSVTFDQLGTEILAPTDRILIEGEQSGSSRYNGGFTLRTRHPIIASVIFANAAPSDEERYQILREIVTLLDPGFIEDRRLLEEFVKREEILATLSDPERKRAIFDLIAKVLPRSAFVLQHRSMLERNLENGDGAVKFARLAIQIDQHNPSLQNTYGLALVLQARQAPDSAMYQAYLKQAEKIFTDGAQKDPSNAFSYVGLFNVMKLQGEHLSGPENTLHQAATLTMLEDAYEITLKSEIVAGLLAEQQRNLGEPKDALKIVRKALETKPSDSKLRTLEVRLLHVTGDSQGALTAALGGLKYDPTAWRLNLWAARLLQKTKGADASVRGYYESARRHQKGNLSLTVEYGAFLFTHSLFSRAAEIFNEAQNMVAFSSGEKRAYSAWWRVAEGSTRNRIFKGTIKQFRGATATIIAIPENFESTCWQYKTGAEQMNVGDKVSFMVAFNAYGAQARIVSEQK
jgi:tetratricopeptide (TPR) repeat protein